MPVDRTLLGITLTLIVVGFFVFLSASLGVLASDPGKFDNILLSQIVFGLAGGGITMYFTSRIKYQFWRKNAFWIFLASIILSLLVFVPGVGMAHGGARRWIDLGITTFQPGEVLKFGVTVYLAAWFAFAKKRDRAHTNLFGLLPLLILLGITGALLLAQPDTGTFLIAAAAGLAMFIAVGGRWRSVVILVLLAVLLVGMLAMMKPYVRDRISTLFHHDDFQGSGYQLRQSLIAIGSGGILGKGFGQSIQKFSYLPEAQGDSIFAVVSEEFGFVGSATIIVLYLLFALRGLWLAAHIPELFGSILATGIVILITAQSFVNIASMLAIIPLTGVPLVFVSHGGTALLVAMAEAGILLNISRSRSP